MADYNTKNYTEQGGNKTVIGGEIEIGGTLTVKSGATVTGLTETAAPASDSALGGVKAAAKGAGDTVVAKIGTDGKLYVPTYPTVPVAANQAASAEASYPTVTEFNALLTKLKSAGLMTADS